MPQQEKASADRGLTRNVWVKNVSPIHQGVGYLEFEPGQALEVPEKLAEGLFKLPQFEPHFPGMEAHPSQRRLVASPIAELQRSERVREFRRAIRPDPPPPDWIADFNRNVFPCETDEFEPAQKAERTFSVSFRLASIKELNGGTRVILRLAGYLGACGHDVTISSKHSDIRPDDVEGLPVRLQLGPTVPDADFVVGTHWMTLLEVSRATVAGQRVGLLQGNEPAWPTTFEPGLAAQAFSLPGFRYIAICEQLAQTCSRQYGTRDLSWLPGNGVDPFDFSPRINNFGPRNGVCFIYRDVWWKGDTQAIRAGIMMQQELPDFRVQAAGFVRCLQPNIDYHLGPDVEQMAMMYSTSDFYLSFSQFEGSPLPPLEAMACGCIPVVTAIGVGDHLRDGENGVLIPHDEPEAAIAAMKAILANDRQRRGMVAECLRTARGRPWRKVCESFEQFLLGGRGRGNGGLPVAETTTGLPSKRGVA